MFNRQSIIARALLSFRARRRIGRSTTCTLTIVVGLISAGWLEAEDVTVNTLGKSYSEQIEPLVQKYCHGCHGLKRMEAEINLAAFKGFNDVKKHPRTWQKVAEMLDGGQMPPEEARQPTDAQRTQLRQWVHSFLVAEAKARAGDPGRVVLRRLSNAEYTYTIRDLTGLGSLDSAREFPVDGAAGEGFTNTGSALVMSPALVTKYLDAAKEIAGHVVLLPDGFRFSRHTTRRDWTDERLRQIREFYRQFTDPGGGDKVNLQGIVFQTNEGGRLPLEKYLAATLAEREPLTAGSETVEAVAAEHGLNAKYLKTMWTSLSKPETSLILDCIRARWRTAKPGDAASLTTDIETWQRSLWKFSTVGHIGKAGGPKRWLEPVNPLVSRQELRLKIPAMPEAKEITISLVATDAGDGNEHDFVVWERPRFVAAGKPDVLLADLCRSVQPAGDVPRRDIGLDAAMFGKHPGDRGSIDAGSICVQAPRTIELHLPAELVAGTELVTTGALDQQSGAEGSVQLQLISGKPPREAGLVKSEVTIAAGNGPWTSNNQKISFSTPILVNENSAARKRFEVAFDEFRDLFPAALCYTKIVPVDEVVTLTLFYREDDHLVRLMLDDAQQRQLDRLWDELHYVSQDALSLVDAFAQLMEFATQDADPKVFEPLRKPIHDRESAFRQRLIDTQPKHFEALLGFAARAYRRPLTADETHSLRAFYDNLRKEGIPHDEAFRLTLARVLIAPAFLYKVETPGPGTGQGRVSDYELASRLSYFLWSSQPDDELRQLAATGQLHETDKLVDQTRRMLGDTKTRRLATEFACQWLHIHDFDHLDEKSERHFPEFARLRGAMYEESIQFFTALFQHNGSLLDILDADYTFLNEDLAKYYDVPGIEGNQWRRVEGVKKYSRGGILAQAATLAKQSGASRTSPTLRGNWISEVLLGERLPRPPKGVPQLPDDETAIEGLTVRQLVEKHASDAKCAVCHRRIDPLGFSLEAFDAIGRRRDKDLADRPIDTHVKASDGAEFMGLDGLRNYLLTARRDAFVGQFCRKLLGYALGRSVQLSDEPLLAEMQAELKASDYKVDAAVLGIVRSRQFREIRGRDVAYEE
jgi:Protein of unknown function (DUF1592)/Protein of unknown function (DUF1588)/Protein of unknown function (DUF1587)/Protein of unknown function (DUF1585)/Protein of unknown function (DUF1595)/Cytochrome C oxidase, cbb3-type, subunit III